MKKIFILTGEPSGDKLASQVIKKLKTKDEERTFIEADEDIQKKKTEVEYYETVVDYLQEIVKQIGQRNFQIKNAIEWRKFEAGM